MSSLNQNNREGVETFPFYLAGAAVMHKIITDYDIQAYVDDELTREEAFQVKEYIDQNPVAQKRYEDLCDQRELLKSWWKNQILNA